jgi:hypothetical protein
MSQLQRTCSGGGPVIGVPAELAEKWRGTLPPLGAQVPAGWEWGQPGGPTCDYDRACNQMENRVRTPYGGFGSVPIDGGLGLVFECEIVTYWVPTEGGGVVVRGPDNLGSLDDAMDLIAAVPAEDWKPWPTRLKLGDGRIFFFDSAIEGDVDPAKIPTRQRVAIGSPGPGSYSIETATDEEENDFIRLIRV